MTCCLANRAQRRYDAENVFSITKTFFIVFMIFLVIFIIVKCKVENTLFIFYFEGTVWVKAPPPLLQSRRSTLGSQQSNEKLNATAATNGLGSTDDTKQPPIDDLLAKLGIKDASSSGESIEGRQQGRLSKKLDYVVVIIFSNLVWVKRTDVFCIYVV